MTYTIEQIMEDLYTEFEILAYQKKTIEELKSEKFEDVSRVHDWRNHVTFYDVVGGLGRDKAIKEWQSLTDLQRLVRYCKAVVESDNEEWE